jgi:multidrug efflux pump subunit AcrB
MKGIIPWFAKNGVAANLLMFGILLAGIRALYVGEIPVEFFPEIEENVVTVSMSYRGATPSEVEQQVVVRIEEAIYDLEGIENLRSEASEGNGSVMVEVAKGYSAREMADDIKARVDAISTFPGESENLQVRTPQGNSTAVSVLVAGDLVEGELRHLAESVRDEMAGLPGISQVEISGVRRYEIGVEVSENTLQEYGLTLGAIAQAIERSSVDLPAGSIKTSGGEVLLRTKGQAYGKDDFEDIVLLTRPDGSRLTIGDIGTVIDGFEENPFIARFNGIPAAVVNVFYTSDQNLLAIADTAKKYVNDKAKNMPPGSEITLWSDRSSSVRERLNTLKSSAISGGILVFIVLTLFLRFQLALWVCVGIPVAFMGAIALMPYIGVTINIITLFAFILVLGIVVDDAIVTGENIYTHLRNGEEGLEAVITGTQEVSTPVTFGVLTTIAAFIPLLIIEGRWGEIFYGIPAIVIPVLIFSLIESKLILPSHLKHMKTGRDPAKLSFFPRMQHGIARSLERFVEKAYEPFLEVALRQRYLVFALFTACVILVVGLISSNRIRRVPFPTVNSDTATVNLEMPIGTPFEVTEPHLDRILAEAEKLREKYNVPGDPRVIEYILSTKGGSGLSRGRAGGGSPNRGEVAIRLVDEEYRDNKIGVNQLVAEWRKNIGPIPGAEELSFRFARGGGGDAIEVEIKGLDFEVIGKAVAELKEHLATYEGVVDIRDDTQHGKEEIQLALKPTAEQLGLTTEMLASQTRHAFFGQEAQRVLRSREDIRVMVRYPLEERQSIENLENMRIRAPDGSEVPLSEVADIMIGRAYSSIVREDRKRTISVFADIDKDIADVPAIQQSLARFVDDLIVKYPGIIYQFGGEIEEQQKTNHSLYLGVLFTIFAIYALLAIPFASYIQPLIVMSVIPFGLIGAVLGHLVMGLPLSQMSMFGMLALSGVIVNDSLVLVDYVNRKRADGILIHDSVRTAGAARFRAIILTSLTTFFGLVTLIFERSAQAQFLVPMAVSLGFGILFATAVTLILIPVNYLILEDIRNALSRYWKWQTTGWKQPARAPQ